MHLQEEVYTKSTLGLSSILPVSMNQQKKLRAVPFKSVGGRRNGKFFKGGEGPNSELVYTIRVYMISSRRGRGVSNF